MKKIIGIIMWDIMLRVMCGLQFKDRERSNDLMLGLNESTDQLATTSVFAGMAMCRGEWMVMS